MASDQIIALISKDLNELICILNGDTKPHPEQQAEEKEKKQRKRESKKTPK